MNITVKKDGEEIEFLYSSQQQGERLFLFHNWTNEKYKGPEGEPLVFFAGRLEDDKNEDKMADLKRRAEKIIKQKLNIAEEASAPVIVEEAPEVKVEESKVEETANGDETEQSKEESTTDEEVKKN